jgi:hypothetical protein
MTDATRSYLVECFWPGVSKAQVQELDSRASRSATADRGRGPRVRYRGSMLLPDDEVVLCFFDGPCEAAVEAAARHAEIPFARIVASTAVPATGRPPTNQEDAG